MSADVERAVHEALQGYLRRDEIAVAWTLTIDVTGLDGQRYLAHRSGGGGDGTDAPVLWAALGMVLASAQAAEEQLRQSIEEVDEDDDF